jgi:hypothetical protein
MANIGYTTHNYKYYYLPQRIGPGALGNDQVKMCKYCSQNGFHNEPIVFHKLSGKWVPFNYFDGRQHTEHKQRGEEVH